MDCKTPAASDAVLKAAYPKERAQYKALLTLNPNYFGSFDSAGLPPVLPMAGNTYYEELGCVGYHPQQEMLEGVVYIYQPSGYGGALCSGGSTEYVRFYLSFDNGATWQDQGLTSFRAWDVPEGTEGSRRLEYAVQMKVNPARTLCWSGSRLIRMRGILSWNAPPPPNQPNWNPPWGNRRDATILVEPQKRFVLDDVFTQIKVKLPFALKQTLDLQAPVAAPPKALSVQELASLYEKSAVPPQRYAFQQLHALAFGKAAPTPELVAQQLPGLKLDPKLVDVLFPPGETDGDTSYEQLTCIGLDPNLPDTLVGIVHVKRSAGFNGGPCTAGSTEYVSWWIDSDGNGSFDTFLGTASVKVHDIANLPAEGVHLAVRLPVDLTAYRKRCKAGPALLPVRAILSWQVPVPGNEPDRVPTWGNREQTMVMLTPSGVVNAPAGQIAILGGVPTSMIDDATGLTTPDAVFALNNTPTGGGAPFGGIVTVQGAPLGAGWRYKVEVRPEGGGGVEPVLGRLTLTRADGTTHDHDPDETTQTYAYVDFANNVNGLLARWFSRGDERWIVTLTTYAPDGTATGTDTHRIQLDNTAPVAAISITSGSGDCGRFPNDGSVQLAGQFTATDANIAEWRLDIASSGPSAPGVSIDQGQTNQADVPWSYNPAGLVPCGYVAEVHVRDKTVVHSQSLGWRASARVGFCIIEADGSPALPG
ncbi:MAG: helix-hairpin-helix domain-containing protein [Rubrivivax sp.]